ncbi:MAG TPA: hypothetical protein VIM77_14100 [Mucilaginibacter sp.]
MEGRMSIRYLSARLHPNVDALKAQVTAIRPCVKTDSSFAAGCDFIASCVYKNDKFKLPVYIPQLIKNHVVKIDTLKHHYRRKVRPLKGVKGTTGVYMREEKVDLSTGILHYGIVMAVYDTGGNRQALAMKIMATLRPKSKE